MPSASLASTVGAGMITASSAARDGAMARAATASAPMAAAQSVRRLNGLRGMVSSYGAGLEGSLERRPRGAIGWQSSGVPQDTRGHGSCYDAAPHEFVNKSGQNPRR